MQDTFLYKVVSELHKNLGDSLKDCRVIFPNKRPENYFKKYLATIAGEDYPCPEISSIEDFISEYSGLALVESIELLCILYKIHCNYFPEEGFDKFHNWGNMLLRDYDEMDKYLVNPKHFFSHLSAAKELEDIDHDDSMALQFWSTIRQQNPTELQAQFLKHWEAFEKIYYDFTGTLLQSKKAYPGMQYRATANKFIEKDYTEGNQYIFIGFNALSRAEEAIIRSLMLEKKALIYFDADAYYYDNPSEEAGYFIRKSIKNLRIDKDKVQFISDKLNKEKKTIHIIGVPYEAGQAKALSENLTRYFLESVGTSAVIMPDENMIQPLLHSLPDNIGQVNFTAGYPLHLSSVYTFFENICELQENFDGAEQSFSHKDVLSVLRHPCLSNREDKLITDLVKHIEKNQLIYIDLKTIRQYKDSAILKIIFEPIHSTERMLIYLESILGNLLKFNSDKRYIVSFEEIFKKLKSFLSNIDFEINTNSFWRFFKMQVAQTKIPFEEDNPDGLQVMGMLETRCLNFDNIFILNVNEGNLPSAKNGHSYIPYDIRRAFHLPVYEEQEALSAYYFYRLIQGAKNIHLYYNSETGSGGTEPSRYIRQLQYFLKKSNPNIDIITDNYTLPLRNHQIKEITFKKDEYFFEKLYDKSNKGGISPTFINSYHACSLQFMLHYVAKIDPPAEISEEFEADRFGTIFHEVMEMVYKEYIENEITANIIKLQRIRIESFLREALKNNGWDAEYYTNKNSLLLETIKVLVNKALDADEEYAPFFIKGMETKLKCPIQIENTISLELQGTIDRIDEKDGILRVIDYKTGNVTKFLFNYDDPEEELNKNNKEAFQTIFYCYLYHKSTGATNLLPTILHLKKVSSGYQIVNEKQGAFQKEDLEKFEGKLKEILSKIFSKDEPVKQTDNLDVCGYCDYKNICLR